jgi:hypothetical protein
MASEASDREGRFVVVGHCFNDVLLGSQVFFMVAGSSWHSGGRCLGWFLETLLHGMALLGG